MRLNVIFVLPHDTFLTAVAHTAPQHYQLITVCSSSSLERNVNHFKIIKKLLFYCLNFRDTVCIICTPSIFLNSFFIKCCTHLNTLAGQTYLYCFSLVLNRKHCIFTNAAFMQFRQRTRKTPVIPNQECSHIISRLLPPLLLHHYPSYKKPEIASFSPSRKS